jgi:hypothetical protein
VTEKSGCALEEKRRKAKLRKSVKNLEPGFPVLREAVTAINRAAFGWLEGNFTFLSAV